MKQKSCYQNTNPIWLIQENSWTPGVKVKELKEIVESFYLGEVIARVMQKQNFLERMHT